MKKTILSSAIGALMALSTPAFADGHEKDLMKVYKHLHANPELSMMEFETAKYLASQLKDMGFEVTESFGKTGVVAVMSCQLSIYQYFAS